MTASRAQMGALLDRALESTRKLIVSLDPSRETTDPFVIEERWEDLFTEPDIHHKILRKLSYIGGVLLRLQHDLGGSTLPKVSWIKPGFSRLKADLVPLLAYLVDATFFLAADSGIREPLDSLRRELEELRNIRLSLSRPEVGVLDEPRLSTKESLKRSPTLPEDLIEPYPLWGSRSRVSVSTESLPVRGSTVSLPVRARGYSSFSHDREPATSAAMVLTEVQCASFWLSMSGFLIDIQETSVEWVIEAITHGLRSALTRSQVTQATVKISVSTSLSLLVSYVGLAEHAASDAESTEKRAAAFVASRKLQIIQELGAVINEHFEVDISQPEQPVTDTVASEDIKRLHLDSSGLGEALDNRIAPKGAHLLSEVEIAEIRAHLYGNDAMRWLSSQLVQASTGISANILDDFRRRGFLIDWPGTQITFRVAWWPGDFLADQYKGPIKPSLEDVIITVSDGARTQMITCGEHVSTTWPTIGLLTLAAIEKAMHGDFGEVRLPHNATLRIVSFAAELEVEARAPPIILADLGELLTCLGAACRSSPFDNECCYCRPAIRVVSTDNVLERALREDTENRNPLECLIQYEAEAVDWSSIDGTACWQSLVRNISIATGFYVPSRTNAECGLEMSLTLMVLLGGAPWADTFDNKLLLKGFSSAYVPVAAQEGSICWHFQHLDDGRFMSYSVADASCIDKAVIRDCDLSWLLSQRHYVGWTADSNCELGTRNADYPSLRRPNADEAEPTTLRRSISRPQYITTDSRVVKGNHQMPDWVSTNQYLQNITELSSCNVLLYDTGAKRAWLVDGCGALLHLTCHQLRSRNFTQNFKISSDSLGRYADTERTPKVVLVDHEITQQVLRHTINNKKGSMSPQGAMVNNQATPDPVQHAWRLQDLVETTCQYLLKMRDCGRNPPGAQFETILDRNELQGWSFFELIEHQPAYLDLLSVKLQSSGRSWTTYIQAIRAITLLGDGFGDLITPAGPADMCGLWATAPTGMDYLITTMGRLRHNATRHAEFPSLITQSVAWHQPGRLFPECTCQRSKVCDPVQVMLSTGLLKVKAPSLRLDAGDARDSAAVIFGSTKACQIWYPRDARKSPQLDLHGAKAALEEEQELRRNPLEDLEEAPCIDLSSRTSRETTATTELVSPTLSREEVAVSPATSIQQSDQSVGDSPRHAATAKDLAPTVPQELPTVISAAVDTDGTMQEEPSSAKPCHQEDFVTTTAAVASYVDQESRRGRLKEWINHLGHRKDVRETMPE